MRNYYDPSSTLRAAILFASVADKYRLNNNYEYDLVDIVRQAMDDQARLQYLRTIADYNGFSIDDFKRDSRRFLDMLLLQDKLLGTRSEFRLGHWVEAARKLGTTEAERNLYEWNARTQITTWGNRTCADKGRLRDYAHKEWQGLLRDFYYKRWSIFFDALLAQMTQNQKSDENALGGGPNANKTSQELFDMALPHGKTEGNSIDIAKEVIDFLK